MTRPILPGRFEPIQFLRESPTVSTFHAADHTLHRSDVLVKVVRKGNFTKDAARLFRSFNWHRGVSHPHIARMLEAGVTSKRDFFYLRPYLERASMFDLRDIASLEKLLAAIDFLHSHGIVHGAIKPSNVFGEGPDVVLADPWLNQNWRKPETEEEVRFTAPEVLAGGLRTIEADLYSVGALVYRFHSGRDLFDDADLDSLARKYSWAAPRPLAAICHASRAVSEIVTELVHKDPARRGPAFEALRDEMKFRQVPSSRAPALGFEDLIEHGHRVLSSQTRSKRMVLIEGAAGSGKTRLVEELRQRFGFQSPSPTVEVCSSVGRLQEEGLARWIVTLYEERYPAYEEEPAVLRLTTGGSEGEQLHRDMIAVMEVMASRAPILFVFEDVDRANKGVLRFLETASRSAMLSVPIVITTRPFGVPRRSLRSIESGFGTGLVKLETRLLGPEDSQVIASFMTLDRSLQESAALRAGGNPLFLESYCIAPGDRVPVRVRRTIGRWIQHLPRRVRRTADFLSVFGHAVSVAALHRITGIPETDLGEDLAYLQRLGLADSSVAIRYRDARLQLYSKLAKTSRRELHARSFEFLQNGDCGKADLARHAHLGGLTEHATRLYLELASTAYAARDFRSAANFYELAAECAGNERAELTPEAVVSLAKCYGYLGNRRLAKSLLGALIAREEVRGDPELLSAVYAARSSPLVESSKQKCVELLRRAVERLPLSSPDFARRHRALAAALIVAGEFEEAEAVGHRAKELSKDEDKKLLDDVIGFIQMNRGAFQEAERSFAAAEFRDVTRTTVLTNRALCVEQLGDLDAALRLHSEALECSKTEGLLLPEIANIASLAAVESKMGDMRAAQAHNASALKMLENVGLRSGTPNLLGSFFADAALHWTHRGNYAEALRFLKAQLASNSTGASPLDVFFMRLAKCEVFLALGNFRKAASVLQSIESSPQGEFFENERLLIRSVLTKPNEQLLTSLEGAIRSSRQQGYKYQECRLSVELASVLIRLNRREEARAVAKEGLGLAQRFGYAPLAARLYFIIGLSSSERSEKETCLVASVAEASKMDLMPLMASASYHLGMLHSDRDDFQAALEHLSRSVSCTLKMADGVPDRGRYLSQPDHQRALQLFEKVASKVRQEPPVMGRPIVRETSLFSGLYKLTSSVITAVTPEASLASLLSSLSQCLSGIPAIVAEPGNVVVTTVPNTVVPEGMKIRASAVFKRSSIKPLFLALGKGEYSGVAVWMPIQALSIRAGIYVEYPVDGAIDEREIEFLTISAAVARVSLDYAGPPLRKVKEKPAKYPSIVGSSGQMQRIYAQIEVASRSSATVLIQGESGTGKELVAKAIHEGSTHRAGQFIAIDCGALPDSLIEAELFGAKKGAYTGANADHIGLFEAAHQGTLFLDEIANASPALQVKLLRALQQREIRRVGETTSRPVDLRLVAATNRDLLPLLQAGEFRQDLYFRLKVLHIQLPPLRERPSDIPLLAASFLSRLNAVHNVRRSFAPGLLEEMSAHYLPGNVRELQNVVERAFHASIGAVISSLEFDQVERGRGQVDTWFRQLLEGETTFWSIRDRFRRRDISREQVTELVDRGLRLSSGSYRALASSFRIKGSDYRRFMDFLRRNNCLLDFRTYRNSVVAFEDE